MESLEQCRDIKQLNGLAQVLLNLSVADIKKQGVNPLIVETYRSQERQNWLYAQGRTRDLKSPVITWTLHSIHTLRNAVDIVPQRAVDGKITAIWNAKDSDTIKIIKTMEKYGWEAGANWKSSPDSPHFQLKGVTADGTTLSITNTNLFLTKVIQKALNKKLEIHLVEDGEWGILTTAAVNQFRKDNKWQKNGKLASLALKTLMI